MGYSSSCTCFRLPPVRRKDGRPAFMYDSFVSGELSCSSAVQNKDSVVRIVLASKMVEVYDGAVQAYSVMQKYPGLCLARPQVFKLPLDSLVRPKEILLPGEKYYLVPKTTLKKLQRRYLQREKEYEEARARDTGSSNKEGEDEEDGLAQELAKPFNPPIKKMMMRRGVLDGWKPELTSIEEASPE